jgi:PKD repeat protein
MIRSIFISFMLMACFTAPQLALAQCPQVMGSAGEITSNPVWYNCTDGLDILAIETASSWSNLVVDWGDDSPLQTFGAFEPGDPAVTHPYVAGNPHYEVTLSEADGSCTLTGLYYAGAPVSDFWSSSNVICQGTAVQFHQETSGPGIQYKWNFGVNPVFLPTSTGHVSFTFQNAGIYEVQSVVLYNGTEAACSDTSSVTIYVLDRPDAEMILSQSSACGAAQLSGEAVSADAFQYVWSFGVSPYFNAGSTLDTIELNGAGTYPISLEVTGINGCRTSMQETVIIHPEPVAGFEVEAVCIGEPSNFVDTSTIQWGTDIIGWYWQFGDGQTSYVSNPSIDYAFAGDYPVSLTVNTPLCTSTFTDTLSAHAIPTVAVSADLLEGCSPLSVNLEATGTLNASYSWDFGNGNTGSGDQVTHDFITTIGNDSTHDLSVTATSEHGCSSTQNLSVIAHAQAVAAFSISDQSACAPFQPTINNQSEGASAYEWLIDGMAAGNATNLNHTFENTSTLLQASSLELIANASNGCHDTTSVIMEVFPEANFSFNLSTDSVCSPLELTMPAIFSASTFNWDFGNGETSIEAQPYLYLANATGELLTSVVTFSGTSAFGCSDTHQQMVHVKPQPVAEIALASANGGCAPFDALFNNNSTNGDIYTWNFGDGSEDAHASGDVNHAFQTGSETANYTVTLTATDALGCADTATEIVTVFPAADFTLPLATDSVCSPLVVTMPTIAGAQNVTWSFGDGTSSNEINPTHTWANNSDELLSALVSFEGQTADGCFGTASAMVHVKPQPVAEIALASANGGCAPFDALFNNNSTNGDVYTWNFGDGSDDAQASGDINHAFQTGSETANYTVTLTATDALGCTDTTTEIVTVLPAADFNLQLATDSVCSPLALTMPTIAGAQNVTWSFGDGTSSNEINPTHTWANNSDELLSALVSFEGQTADGCFGTASAMVHVKPQPVAAFDMSVDSGCEPLNTTFSNASEGADSYVWSFGNGQAPESMASASDVEWTYETSGEPTTFTVTLIAIDALGCTDERTAEINVLPTPVYALDLEFAEACSPFVAIMPIMEDAVTTFWSFGDGTMSNEATPSHSWFNNSDVLESHNIQFQGANEYGCFNETSTTIAVKPQPIANFSKNSDAGCAPFDVVFSNESVRADIYDWDYGNGNENAFSNTSDHDYTYEGESALMTYTVALTATHALGCSDLKLDSVTVFPEVFATWVGSVEGCAPFETNLEYIGAAVETIQWDLGNESESTEAMTATSYAGAMGADANYTVSLAIMSENGCADQSTFDVTVHPTPLTGLSIETAASCAETEVLISNASAFADSVVLNLGNGTTLINSDLTSIPVTYSNDSASDLTFTLTQEVFTDFGCAAATTVAHTVHPKVTAAIETPEAACAPALVQLGNNSINATGTAMWLFGDGSMSNASAPEHLFSSESTLDTTYVVTLVAQNAAGCSDTTTVDLIVWGTPQAQLSLNNLDGCYPVEVTFENLSEGQTSNMWAYGNGQTSATNDSLHSKVFFNPTSELIVYETVLTTINDHGCASEATVSFEVAPHLNAAFSAVTAGCSPVNAQLINQSEGAVAFSWNFNDGSIPSNEVQPDHAFVNNTDEDLVYEVQLIAQSAYGCVDTVSVGVHVYPMPIASFSVTPVSQTYPNATVGINNMSLSSNAAVQYWSFGDGAELAGEQPIFHTYNTWGTYNITLLVDNGYCADAQTEQIQILSPNPVADFVGSGAGCAPLLVAFDNLSNHGAGYVWDFGDDYMTSEESPVHVYTRPGVYNVSLTAIGYEGQEHEAVHYATVEVFPSATAAFVFSPSEVVAPDQPVEFINLSDQGATEFLWTFGDGMVSTEENPIYTYSEAGIYDVSLTANNAFNCPSTFIIEEAIEATNGGFMEFPTAFTPNNGGSNGGGYDPASLDNDVFHPHHLGIVEFEMVVFNKWGELLFRTTDPYIGWDGYFQGRIARQDVYAWRATAQFSNGHRVTKAGDVTLIIQ